MLDLKNLIETKGPKIFFMLISIEVFFLLVLVIADIIVSIILIDIIDRI